MRQRVIEFKGGAVTLMTLHLHSAQASQITQTLSERVSQAPNFYRAAPVVLDFSPLAELNAQQITDIVAATRAVELQPIAARCADDDQRALLNEAGLPTLRRMDADEVLEDIHQPQEAGSESEVPPPPAAAPVTKGVTVDRVVRSGQQIYARRGDLVVIGAASAGSELIADGNIHVYGPLRGRALCGVNGNEQARIFCNALEAELVSVAGNYKLLEEVPAALRGRPVQIYLDGEKLRILPME